MAKKLLRHVKRSAGKTHEKSVADIGRTALIDQAPSTMPPVFSKEELLDKENGKSKDSRECDG